MGKDPAFLFYSKDFISGTQEMTCEEVGTFLRLLLYQHQHKLIPNDPERLMRITGIFSLEKFNTIWQVVNQKFNQTGSHLFNQRLADEMDSRAFGKLRKIASATFAGLMSSHKTLTDSQKTQLRNSFNTDQFIEFESSEIKLKVREWFKNLVNQMVNNIANVNGDVIEDVIENNGKEGTGEKPKPVIMPFPSSEFASQWANWKSYLTLQHKFTHEAPESEQAALMQLNTLSAQNETTAIAILHQSMAKGWKGLFELNTQQNAGKPPARSKQAKGYSDGFKRKIAERLQSG